MFPSGLPGLGLLLLRGSVAIALLVERNSHDQDLSGWIELAAILPTAALCAGFLTPIAAVLAVAFHALIWFRVGFSNAGLASIVCLDALALAFLGPGAYSIDSLRFGRRVLVSSRR